MYFFTGDTHFGETPERLKLMFRDGVAPQGKDFDKFIIDNWNSVVGKDDIVFHLGDFAFDKNKLDIRKQLNVRSIILVRGNHDKSPVAELKQYFDKVLDNYTVKFGGRTYYLNHYPSRGKKEIWNICAHVHGHFRSQRNMINVGLDVWHWKPVSVVDVDRLAEAIEKHYDQDIFAGELDINTEWKDKHGQKGSYADTITLEKL